MKLFIVAAWFGLALFNSISVIGVGLRHPGDVWAFTLGGIVSAGCLTMGIWRLLELKHDRQHS